MGFAGSFKRLIAYTPLIKELVVRDLKIKYRRSILGYFWSLLNPLLMMAIMTFVFSTFFKSDMEYFPLYLISGNTLYAFFTESTTIAMNSVLTNGTLIKKVYIPKFIFPLASVFSSFVTMSFSLVAVLIVLLFLHVPIYWQFFLFPIPIMFELVFCCGVGMVLSSLAVYFRDIQHLYGVFTLALLYMTPIFYPVKMMPADVIFVIKLNPLYHYITAFRLLIMNGYIADINTWLGCIVSSFSMLIIGILVFRKAQRNFILYL